jgi:hypothetical protein
MLSIILLILKIIGYFILALLGLLLLILFTILLVPIRYRVLVEHGEAFYVKGRVHWLLHIIHAGFSYVENKPHICVRLFGFILYDNLKPKKQKVKKRAGRSSPKHSRASHSKAAKAKDAKLITEQSATPSLPPEHDKKNIPAVNTEKMPESAIIDKQYKQEQKSTRQSSEKKVSLFHKLLDRFRAFKEKLIAGIKSFIMKIKNLFTTIQSFYNKWELISDFIRDDVNRQAFSVSFRSLKKFLRHILPTKVRSKIIFGTGDPCTTGQLLGVLGFFYGFYGDSVQITPDFVNSRLEGEHDVKGRIRLITILIIVVKLILNKQMKSLKKNVILLKEAL